MITLATRAAEFSGEAPTLEQHVVRLSRDAVRPISLRNREAFLLGDGPIPEGFAWYIRVGSSGEDTARDGDLPLIQLPSEFGYLADGDILRVFPAKNLVRAIFRKEASINSFLLTERCNNLCLMCSQPPRNVNDGWIVDELLETLALIDFDVPEIMFSGGEPTLLGDRFLELVQASKSFLPRTSLHILSNGRSFANAEFARKLARIDHPDLMVGIPLYSDLAHIHDYVVQADGAYDETVRGILNLKQEDVPVEVRVVLHKQTVPRLADLAEFLARNLLFVDHVALMGLEMTGFTKANLEDLWIDPADYADELRKAVGILDRARINTSIYNTQLCLIDRSIWRFAKRSISDWKQEFMPECEGCAVKSECGGFFSSAELRYSAHIRPIAEMECVS
jgi:His-Xaa-Ser system radical SAM maturase HxsC